MSAWLPVCHVGASPTEVGRRRWDSWNSRFRWLSAIMWAIGMGTGSSQQQHVEFELELWAWEDATTMFPLFLLALTLRCRKAVAEMYLRRGLGCAGCAANFQGWLGFPEAKQALYKLMQQKQNYYRVSACARQMAVWGDEAGTSLAFSVTSWFTFLRREEKRIEKCLSHGRDDERSCHGGSSSQD